MLASVVQPIEGKVREMRRTEAPTRTEAEAIGGGTAVKESHPAFGLIRAGRSTGGQHTLFDSDIQHNATVTVTVCAAERERSLNRDRIYPVNRSNVLAEVVMSEAQWASFVSSMNTGHGVPCTIERRDGDWDIPGLPYEPRMAESMAEVRNAGDRALAAIREAFEAVEAKPTKANIRTLKFKIQNATPNMVFAAESLTEHAENVVQKSRADIEAMVVAKAQQLGIDPADLGSAPQIGQGDE